MPELQKIKVLVKTAMHPRNAPIIIHTDWTDRCDERKSARVGKQGRHEAREGMSNRNMYATDHT